jgi:hypothetical protein
MEAVRGHLLLTAFFIFGIGTEVLAVIALFVMFRRRGWMGKKS